MGKILDFAAEIFRARCPNLEVGVNTTRQKKGEMGMRSQTSHYAMSITLKRFTVFLAITLLVQYMCNWVSI